MFCLGGFGKGGFCPGVYVWGVFVLEPGLKNVSEFTNLTVKEISKRVRQLTLRTPSLHQWPPGSPGYTEVTSVCPNLFLDSTPVSVSGN